MRVGIITFHCSYNFGSALQAYALQRAISMLGNDVSIIDYRSSDFNYYHLISITHPRLFLRSLTRLRGLVHRRRSFHQFWNKYFNLYGKFTYRNEDKLSSLNECFDCFVCGSDQIWNLDCTQGAVGPFFLSFVEGARKVSYAPSLAHTSFRPEFFDKREVASLLDKFDYLSIREEETVPLFQPLVNKRIEVVVDPTLLLNRDAYLDMTEERIVQEPYLFVYLLRKCPELIESASELSRRINIKVAYISERNLQIPNSINLFGVGPEEFVSLIANAEAVLTNSFHATAFSVILHRPFRAFAVDESASRMREFTSRLGIAARCVSRVDSSSVESENWLEVDQKLDLMRAESWSYLKKALS